MDRNIVRPRSTKNARLQIDAVMTTKATTADNTSNTPYTIFIFLERDRNKIAESDTSAMTAEYVPTLNHPPNMLDV
jgi:hypothetical protein